MTKRWSCGRVVVAPYNTDRGGHTCERSLSVSERVPVVIEVMRVSAGNDGLVAVWLMLSDAVEGFVRLTAYTGYGSLKLNTSA